jgi:hypothetical protein
LFCLTCYLLNYNDTDKVIRAVNRTVVVWAVTPGYLVDGFMTALRKKISPPSSG